MRLLFKILSGVAFIVAAVWIYHDPKFDSYFAAAIALAAFVGCFVGGKRTPSKPGQSQQISRGSVGIQGGRDVNVGDVNKR